MRTATVLLHEATRRLADAEVPSPRHDATALLAHVLGVARGLVPMVVEVDPAAAHDFDALVRRRAAREPLQHLLGRVGFRTLELEVGPGVFVPRPETELLAGWAVDQARQVAHQGRTPVVVDLCTGSGAIALAVLEEVGHVAVHAVEVDPAAYAWAERNVGGRAVDLRLGDMHDAFHDLDGSVDVVVANPPYIPLEAWESVAPEARDHDPSAALWSGVDGLDAVRVVSRVAARLLRDGGHVGVEHADVQGRSVPATLREAGSWVEVADHPDLSGRPRYATARRAARAGTLSR